MGIKVKKAEELPNAKPVVLSQNSPSSKPQHKPRDEVALAVDQMIERGDIVPRDVMSNDLTDPKLREDFGRLLYVGANKGAVCEILQISSVTYDKLKRQHIEAAVESLAEMGVVGTVALSFEKLEEASRRASQLVASLGDTKEDRQDLMNALRLLQGLESEKINLLVKTGAIKVKKKIEISTAMEKGSAIELFSGEKAQRVMVNLMTALVEEEDAELVEEKPNEPSSDQS